MAEWLCPECVTAIFGPKGPGEVITLGNIGYPRCDKCGAAVSDSQSLTPFRSGFLATMADQGLADPDAREAYFETSLRGVDARIRRSAPAGLRNERAVILRDWARWAERHGKALPPHD